MSQMTTMGCSTSLSWELRRYYPWMVKTFLTVTTITFHLSPLCAHVQLNLAKFQKN